jgi:hypothetical protein
MLGTILIKEVVFTAFCYPANCHPHIPNKGEKGTKMERLGIEIPKP